MKKRKQIISLFIAVSTAFCFATQNVSAFTFLNIDTQFGAVSFPLMTQPHIVPIDKPSKQNPKKENPNHPNKKAILPSSSTQNSIATSSSSSVSPSSSSESASSTALSTSSIVNSTSSSESNASLLLSTGICLVVGLGLTALAFIMHKRNKKKTRWLDETCEIRIDEEIPESEDTDKDKK